jgi:hypothetical protein
MPATLLTLTGGIASEALTAAVDLLVRTVVTAAVAGLALVLAVVLLKAIAEMGERERVRRFPRSGETHPRRVGRPA